MGTQKKLKLSNRNNKKYKSVLALDITSRVAKTELPQIESYEVDIEKLREALREIEETYYSSNIKLERIKKQKLFDILCTKIPIVFKSYKRIFKLINIYDKKASS